MSKGESELTPSDRNTSSSDNPQPQGVNLSESHSTSSKGLSASSSKGRSDATSSSASASTSSSGFHPKPLPAPGAYQLPESLAYRFKRRVLGKPISTDRIEQERLGRPTALAVFASDNLSSCAYATEEILHVLIPAVGIYAFSLVVPITVAMLVVLAFLILSYRETIKAYPSAGGAYVVTRDNFGRNAAQVAGVALMTDYILTVAVSVSAGTAALGSAFPGIKEYTVPISVGWVIIIGFANLRGVRESGSIFRIPTYFFVMIMLIMLGLGAFKFFTDGLHPVQTHGATLLEEFGIHGAIGTAGAVFYGASLFKILHAFASGGAAVTGVEAISNGVTAFKPPEWKNARSTLVIMGSLLGVMFLGLSMLASKLHISPFEGGTPTVISQIGEAVFGSSTLGKVFYYLLQGATMAILVLAANTAFADFPRLTSFEGEDGFMPRQLTKRGHRLVYSNGIILLSVAAIALVIATGAQVNRLIPLYAVGVFLGFTLSQSGMTKHHFVKRESGWKKGFAINAFGTALSATVLVIIAITKFTHGAWVIMALIPILVLAVLRLNKQYRDEAASLEADVISALSQRTLKRHVALVFVNKVDASTARALQYARTLAPDQIRAVHIAHDPDAAKKLANLWSTLPLSRIPLELVECPDRRIPRAALEYVASEVDDGETEVTVMIPQRIYRRIWHKLLHDATAENMADALSMLTHVNVTLVPFHLGMTPGPAGQVSEMNKTAAQVSSSAIRKMTENKR